jgi:tRNA1(Val) A37 N6-methylase TrmN6
VGFEVDPGLVKLAREKINQQKLEQRVEIRHQDFMTAELSPPRAW